MNFQDKCFSQAPGLVYRKIADECILVPIRQNVAELQYIYVLNEVGGRIWELLDGQKTLEQIKERLVAEFEVSPQQAEADLVEFIEQLQAVGSIKAA